MRTRVSFVLLTALSLALSVAGTAQATTGAGAGLPPPNVYIDPRVMGRYVGLFELTQVDRRAKITGAEIAIDYTELPPQYPIGRISVRGYDADGRQTSYQANLYKFQGKDAVRAQILNQGDNSVMGHLVLYDPTEKGSKGILEIDGQKYRIAMNRYDDDDGPPPNQKVVQTGPRFDHATQAGWGDSAAAAAGTYSLVNTVTDPGLSAGPFAAVVRVAQGVSGSSTAPSDGQLTVENDGGDLSGTLELDRSSGTETVYLSNFQWGGASRSADVHSGSATGPEVGTFQGTFTDGELSGTLTVNGAKTDLELQHDTP